MAYGSLNVDTLTSSTGQVFSPSSSVMKNRIINGAMVINQRAWSGSITAGTNYVYTLDRWKALISLNDKFTVSQNAGSVTPPAGFSNYLGCTSSAATSLGATDFFQVTQCIEGYNVADLAWGTSSGKSVTVSFWAYSSLTGSFSFSVGNSAGNSWYPVLYSIPTANTWTYVTITIPAPPNGTTWVTNSGLGIDLRFSLGTGSTYSNTSGAWNGGQSAATGATPVVGTSGATFYITGVQLEVGTVATQFEYRQYGTEFALCQRYFQTLGGTSAYSRYGWGQAYSSTGAQIVCPLRVTMRASPSFGSIGSGNAQLTNSTAGGIAQTSAVVDNMDVNMPSVQISVASGLSAGNATQWTAMNTTSFQPTFSAEL